MNNLGYYAVQPCLGSQAFDTTFSQNTSMMPVVPPASAGRMPQLDRISGGRDGYKRPSRPYHAETNGATRSTNTIRAKKHNEVASRQPRIPSGEDKGFSGMKDKKQESARVATKFHTSVPTPEQADYGNITNDLKSYGIKLPNDPLYIKMKELVRDLKLLPPSSYLTNFLSLAPPSHVYAPPSGFSHPLSTDNGASMTSVLDSQDENSLYAPSSDSLRLGTSAFAIFDGTNLQYDPTNLYAVVDGISSETKALEHKLREDYAAGKGFRKGPLTADTRQAHEDEHTNIVSRPENLVVNESADHAAVLTSTPALEAKFRAWQLVDRETDSGNLSKQAKTSAQSLEYVTTKAAEQARAKDVNASTTVEPLATETNTATDNSSGPIISFSLTSPAAFHDRVPTQQDAPIAKKLTLNDTAESDAKLKDNDEDAAVEDIEARRDIDEESDEDWHVVEKDDASVLKDEFEEVDKPADEQVSRAETAVRKGHNGIGRFLSGWS